MREKTIPLAIVIVMLVYLSSPIVMAQPPMPPCWFYGTVSVEGLPAQDNLNVTAGIRGTNLTWTTETKNGTYGWRERGSDRFYVPYDNLTTPNKDGGVNDDIIEFYLNGTKTNQTATFESMTQKRVDLTVGSTHGDNGGNGNGGNGSTFNPHLLYATLAIVIIGIGFVAVFWIYRKKVSSKKVKEA